MFKFLKNIIFSINDNINHNTFDRYLNMVDAYFNREDRHIFANFNVSTFNYIFTKLLGATNNSLYIFVKSYDMYFNDVNFYLLVQLAEKLNHVGGKINIITFDELNNDKLLNLKFAFPDVVFYYSSKILTNSKCKFNNFITSDSKRLIIEDSEVSVYDRKPLNIRTNDYIKNKICFNDNIRAAKLNLYFEQIKEQITDESTII